eukprot:11921751-Alexandrium_andersonii.AAC.1
MDGRPSAKQLGNFRASQKQKLPQGLFSGSLVGTLQPFVDEEHHNSVTILKHYAEVSAHLIRISFYKNSLLQQACAFVASAKNV